MAKEDNIVTYRNDKKIKEIKTSEKKFSLKHLYGMFKGSAAYVIGFLFSNKAWILFTGLSSDGRITGTSSRKGKRRSLPVRITEKSCISSAIIPASILKGI